MTLRTATSTRTWENGGDTTTHYWCEIEPDLWLEVTTIGTDAEMAAFREAQADKMTLRAHTSYLRRMSDTLAINEQPEHVTL